MVAFEAPLFHPSLRMHSAWVNEEGLRRFSKLVISRCRQMGTPPPSSSEEMDPAFERLFEAWRLNGWKSEWVTLQSVPSLVQEVIDSFCEERVHSMKARQKREDWMRRDASSSTFHLPFSRDPLSSSRKEIETDVRPSLSSYSDFLRAERALMTGER